MLATIMTRRKKRKSIPKAPDPIEIAARTGNWSGLARRASSELRRSTGQIEAGETFASQKAPESRAAPSAKRTTRNS